MFNIISFLRTRLQVRQLPKGSLLVLAYHNVENKSTVGEDLYTVTTANFIQHISIINKFFTAITPKQLFTTNRFSKPRILITFDDGRKNNFMQAFPILDQFGLPALFFITADFIGTDGYMTKKDIKHLSQHNMFIGSHGLTHADFGSIDMQQVKNELAQSKKILTTLLLKEIYAFAYPYGNTTNMNEYDKEILLQCGYQQAYIFGGTAAPEKEDPYRIPRFMVTDVLGTTFLGHVIAAIKNQKNS
jgi:peptidoglycan/xylan/chitin deacetylase (PgdA/CDA1 family)